MLVTCLSHAGHMLVMNTCTHSMRGVDNCFFYSKIITGTYNNFFRIFNRNSNESYTYEASRDMNTLGQILRNKRVVAGTKKRRDEVPVQDLDYPRKILHPVWHPKDNILAIAATNNLYLFHEAQP